MSRSDVVKMRKGLLLAAGCLAAAVLPLQAAATGQAAPPATSEQGVVSGMPNRYARDGVVIDFEARPVEGDKLMEDKLAELVFRFTDERTGKPLQGARPAAWMDIGSNNQGRPGSEQRECKEKVGLYLKGSVGIRPLVDLNGYYLLIMNRDNTITVVDPMVSMAGRTSTYQVIQLRHPPMDWADQKAQKRLFVSMPAAGEVALIDTESFKVVSNIPAGKNPVRVVLQPDGRYLWVGNDAAESRDSGVTVIDTTTLKVAMQVPTGRGHHEIALSADSRHAYVTNRDDGTVSVFEVATLTKLKDIRAGSVPLSVAWSGLSGAAYVADGKEGTITVIDGASHEVSKRIAAEPGLGPLRFTRDGRYALVVNTAQSLVHVIDPATNEIIHRLPVEKEPFQIVFSPQFAYVRPLASEHVTMIDLSSLGKGREPRVQKFPAGAAAPRTGGDLPLADSMAVGLGESTAFVVNPGENTTYFYMEGMNSPMNNYRAQGHAGRAVTVVDRSLRETEPGIFVGRFRMPVAGHFDVALQLEQPRMLHCFATDASANPEKERLRHSTNLDMLTEQRVYNAGEPARLRFRLLGGDGMPRTGLKRVLVRYFRLPSSAPSELIAPEVEPGVHEIAVELPEPGAYYVYVGVPELKIGFTDMAYVSLLAKPNSGPGAAPAAATGAVNMR